MKKNKLAKMIDHTLLKPEATMFDIINLCEEAKKYGFFSVCVNSSRVSLAHEILEGSNVKICTVVGFPLGACNTISKKMEAKQSIIDGANEIDMVINIGMLKDRNLEYVYNDIKEIVEASKGKALVKVIIETGLLTDNEKRTACILAKDAGADFIKTSTGFLGEGAKKEDIVLIRETVGNKMKIKASGGIKTYEDALEMIKSGADRIGTSASIDIISNANNVDMANKV